MIDVNDVKDMLGQQGLVILQLQGRLREAEKHAADLAQSLAQQEDERIAREADEQRERMARDRARFDEMMAASEPEAGTAAASDAGDGADGAPVDGA